MRKKRRSARAVAGGPRRKTVLVLADAPGTIRGDALSPEWRGVLECGRRFGWDILDLHHWGYEVPQGVRPDGLIARCDASYHDLVAAWHARAPVGVVLHAPYATEGPYPYPIVRMDTVMIGDKAADYFLERRFRNTAVCHYGEPVRFTALREFEARVKGAGATCASIPCRTGDSLSARGKAVKRQLAELELPLAIFCTNDRLAVRVCRWCREMGLAVPEQVAILGRGNDLMACEYNPVPLSSIDLAPEQVGTEAARLLQRMMDGAPAPAEPLRVPVGGVITRRSTDILAVPDAAVAHALRYIWDRYRENIGVDDIAAACGASRSKLAHHFRAELGRTVVQELTRHRLQRACELLTSGDALIADVAALSGYRSPQYFNGQFKRAFGVSPQRYRQRERKARRLVKG